MSPGTGEQEKEQRRSRGKGGDRRGNRCEWGSRRKREISCEGEDCCSDIVRYLFLPLREIDPINQDSN